MLELQAGSSSFSGAFPGYCTLTMAERFHVVLTLWVKKWILVEFSCVSHGRKSNRTLQVQILILHQTMLSFSLPIL